MDFGLILVLAILLGGFIYFWADARASNKKHQDIIDNLGDMIDATEQEPGVVIPAETLEVIQAEREKQLRLPTDEALAAMTKTALAAFAKEEFGVTLSTAKTKADMIADFKQRV